MSSNEGENDVSISETTSERTALVPQRKIEFGSLVDSAINRTDVGDPRRIRRGRFFLSNYDQRIHGSLSRPIFQYWGHGVVVGDMVPAEVQGDYDPDGHWCYATHDDFDLIPASTPPNDWPEYTRTSTGWVRKDGVRRLVDIATKQLRLK
jgi:hypothetical protein